MWILKQTNKKYCGFGLAAEVMLEVMQEVMSAETVLIKWSEVFFIIVYCTTKEPFPQQKLGETLGDALKKNKKNCLNMGVAQIGWLPPPLSLLLFGLLFFFVVAKMKVYPESWYN